jgi:hypothetical protein
LAFEILSAGIYTDRAMAPVRELMCNAIDAHAEANNLDQPYIVHLPNNLESFWSIRDYGTGLPPEMVKRLYTRYFKSTKTQSDVPIGFMGLGSKSPFAYVESFNVTSYWNGTKYMYSAYRNELKMPCIAPLGEEKTDEQNGMEISFPVGKYDYGLFCEKTRQALKFFERMPTVVGVHNFKVPDNVYTLRGDGYGITAKKEQESFVVMANVGYSFDPNDFYNTAQQLSSRERKMVDWGIHLFVPNGTVMPAASREKITWTENARIAVKECLGRAIIAIEEEAKKSLINVFSIWDARLAVNKAKTGILSEIVDISTVEWQGNQLTDLIILRDYVNPPSLVETMTCDDDAGYKYYRKHAARIDNFYRVKCDSFTCNIPLIFINDLKRGGYVAVKTYMEKNSIKDSVIFSDDVLQEFIDEVGCGHLIVRTSTLPKVPRAPRGSIAKNANRTMLQKWDVNGDWSDAETDLSEGGIYFEVRRNKVKRVYKDNAGYDFTHSGNLQKYVDAVKVLDSDNDDEIFVIRPCDLAKIQKHEGWITYYDHMGDVLKRNSSLFEDACKLETLDSLHAHSFSLLKKFVNELDDKSQMKKAILAYEDLLQVKSNKDKVEAFNILNKYHQLYHLKSDEATVKLLNNVYDHYPLLKYVSIHYDNAVRYAVDYIKIMDEKNASISDSAEAA